MSMMMTIILGLLVTMMMMLLLIVIRNNWRWCRNRWHNRQRWCWRMRCWFLYLGQGLVHATVSVDKIIDKLRCLLIVQLMLGHARSVKKLLQLFLITIVHLIIVRFGVPTNVLKMLKVCWNSNVLLLQYFLLILIFRLFAKHTFAVNMLR